MTSSTPVLFLFNIYADQTKKKEPSRLCREGSIQRTNLFFLLLRLAVLACAGRRMGLCQFFVDVFENLLRNTLKETFDLVVNSTKQASDGIIQNGPEKTPRPIAHPGDNSAFMVSNQRHRDSPFIVWNCLVAKGFFAFFVIFLNAFSPIGNNLSGQFPSGYCLLQIIGELPRP